MTLRGNSAVLDAPHGTFAIEERDVPEPRPGGLLLRQELCGVCATDAYVHRGHLPGTVFPLVLGHETIGIVERLGPGTTEDATGRPLAVGDRVSVAPGVSCGHCVFCAVHRQPTLCLNRRGYGFRPRRDEPPHFQGGFAQYVDVAAGATVLTMAVDATAAVTLEPLTIGIHAATRANIPLGATVVIQGSGAIGILALAAAREAGALRTIVVGGPATRLALAREFGADVTIDLAAVPDPAERTRLVRAETPGGHGADVAIECAGTPAAISEGIDMLRRGGVYVEAGHYTDHGDIPLNPFRHLVNKHITLVGVWSAGIPHFVAGRALIESGRYPFADLVSHVLPLERVADGVGAIGGSYLLDGTEIRKVAIAANG
ncbi:MAG: alcohol dehydrogenase catalytic domain-containing protein [Thermomicrobiales bacterium]|nr:alcohol dehydrogenase catalytic domain-containing protein [Thermomicrobiales bacterium]